MTENVCHHVSAEHGVMAALTTLHISCTTSQLVSMSTRVHIVQNKIMASRLSRLRQHHTPS
jgi:hypothetical protein